MQTYVYFVLVRESVEIAPSLSLSRALSDGDDALAFQLFECLMPAYIYGPEWMA